jgi:flagellar biosynthesis protein FlhB
MGEIDVHCHLLLLSHPLCSFDVIFNWLTICFICNTIGILAIVWILRVEFEAEKIEFDIKDTYLIKNWKKSFSIFFPYSFVAFW